jgi:hypothetical protein
MENKAKMESEEREDKKIKRRGIWELISSSSKKR